MWTARKNYVVAPVNSQLAYAAGYTVLVYPVGAVVRLMSTGQAATVHASGSFEPGDVALVWRPSTYELISTAIVNTVSSDGKAITFTTAQTLYPGDRLVNLGLDGGTPGTPQWDASRVWIYTDPEAATRIPNSRMTTTQQGEYLYYHRGDGRVWEIILDGGGLLVGVFEGFGGQDERLNVYDFGASGDATKASNAAARNLSTNQVEYDPFA